MKLKDLMDFNLGEYEINYEARDAILYALSVGARADQLDLVYERDLRVLPTYACALGLWAVERAGKLGAYDRERSLHASQSLVIHREMPREGRILGQGRIAAVWDKGKASIVDVEVRSDFFTATYTIFLPGVGGWGGQAGSKTAEPEIGTTGVPWQSTYPTSANLAALYRLTGDRHPIHIDPDVATANGFERPILHGLCTLGIAAREIAYANNRHPADLRNVTARLSGPVLPGDAVTFSAWGASDTIAFEARVGERSVLKGGRAIFLSKP